MVYNHHCVSLLLVHVMKACNASVIIKPCVAKIFELYESISPIFRYFSKTVSNKERFDNGMDILGLTPIHLLSQCNTTWCLKKKPPHVISKVRRVFK